MMNLFFQFLCKLALISFFAVVIAACDQTSKGTGPDEVPVVSLWEVPLQAEQEINPVRYDVDSVSAGKRLFEQHCQQCHGYYGEGNGIIGAILDQRPANLLRLAGKQAEGAFAWKIREGRSEMPSFQGLLSDREIWEIVNFVASLENEEGTQP